MKRFCRFIALMVLASVTACVEKVSQEDLIRSAVALRVQQWEEDQRRQCKDRALTRALVYTDSLLIATSLESKLDTIPGFIKPDKPEKPGFKEKPDTVIVRPIFEKEN